MWTALRLFAARLRAQFGGSSQDREFAQELESHLEMLTEENLRRGMTADEAARKARLTLGVVAARTGDLEQAVNHGQQALAIDRRSQPPLLMVGKELDDVLRQRYGSEPGTTDFHDALIQASRGAA